MNKFTMSLRFTYTLCRCEVKAISRQFIALETPLGTSKRSPKRWPRTHLHTSPTHADNTSMHQLLHLRPDGRVLEMFLQRSRVVLCLLEDALHDGVLQDACDLPNMSVRTQELPIHRRLTSGSRWTRSMVCASVSPSRAEYCACSAFCSCCWISRAFLPSLSFSEASVHVSIHLLYSRMVKYAWALRRYARMKVRSRLIASSQSWTADGNSSSLIKQAARFEYPRGSSGARLIISEYASTAAGQSASLNLALPSSRAFSASSGLM
jgi:hypothetical protein